jgi:hypothetical protein
MPAIAAQRARQAKAACVGISGDPLLDPLHHRRQQHYLVVLNEGLGF